MCLYLTKRVATYYFRRAIPDELQAAFDGRTEFVFSLQTKDRDVAKRRRSVEAIRTDGLLDDVRAALRAPLDAAPSDPWKGMTQEQFEEQLEHQARETRLSSKEDDAWLAAQKWDAGVPADHPASLVLRNAREERDGYRDRYKVRKQRDIQREAREPTLWLSPAATPSATPDGMLLTAGEGITDIVDLWAAERKVQPKGIDTHRAVARWFYERAGTKAVDKITRQDVLAFKSKLLEEGQTAANIRMKLSRLRTLLQCAFVNDYAPLNAAQGIEIKDTPID